MSGQEPIWRPAEQEPDLLEEAAIEAIRARLFGRCMAGFDYREVPGTPYLETELEDRRRVRASVTSSEPTETRLGLRDCLSVRVSGEIATAREGFIFSGELILDRATGAILDTLLRLESVGRLGATT